MPASIADSPVISTSEFVRLVGEVLQRDLADSSSTQQLEAITRPPQSVLQLVAGPGSGKTSVLVLRALHLVLVDKMLPENILITTFTRRAARELRSRWLEWGHQMCHRVSNDHDLSHVDLNRCQIDTLDSIIHNVLSDHREAGLAAPDIADPTTSRLILKRESFQSRYYSNQDLFDQLLARYTFGRRPPPNQAGALKITKTLLERLIQDRVDLDQYCNVGQAEAMAVAMLRDYNQILIDTNTFDHAALQEHFLYRLRDGTLPEWVQSLEALFIDEYQDTNPLQEAIYFEIIAASKPSVTVVGDDDQSLYRFRGGSVELFTDFASRCSNATGLSAHRIDMVRNYRSRPEIVDFVNHFVSLDAQFQAARVTPPKPPIVATRASEDIPILGMFRDDEETLADALAEFLHGIVTDRSRQLGSTGLELALPDEGDLGDFVFLGHSVNEVDFNRYGGELVVRFPGMLREAMQQRGLHVFNPRGQPLRSLESVGTMLGLLLHAIDEDGSTADGMSLTNEARFFLNAWRGLASDFLTAAQSAPLGSKLRRFIGGWQSVSKGETADGSLSDFPVLELLFTIMSFLPQFQRDPEHQVWLETITRVIAGSGRASAYGMSLLQNVSQKNHGVHVTRSRESLIRDVLVPIAEDEVDVDEDIMPSVPRDRFQLMTIHQSKGLEFPLVIVDVGSRFKIDHAMQRFRRFPEIESSVVIAEDDVEPHLPGPLRGHRSGLDRTFDDLVRMFYVAYSRAQCALLLVGHENQLRYRTNVRNIALGWTRGGDWAWKQPHTGRQPPVKIEPPFLEI